MRLVLELALAADAGLQFTKIGMPDGNVGAQKANAMTVRAVWIARQVVVARSQIDLGRGRSWIVG